MDKQSLEGLCDWPGSIELPVGGEMLVRGLIVPRVGIDRLKVVAEEGGHLVEVRLVEVETIPYPDKMLAAGKDFFRHKTFDAAKIAIRGVAPGVAKAEITFNVVEPHPFEAGKLWERWVGYHYTPDIKVTA